MSQFDVDIKDCASEELLKDENFIMDTMNYVVEYFPIAFSSDKVVYNSDWYIQCTRIMKNILRGIDDSIKNDEDILKTVQELTERTSREPFRPKGQPHSASEVAELDGVKTSDIQAVYNEIVNENEQNKEDSKNIDEQ